MRVAIIAFNNIKFSPYILPYAEILKKIGADIELVFPNRNHLKEEFAYGKLVDIKWDSSKSKILNFIYFKKSVSATLKKKGYDFVIVLTTFPAVLLSGVLSSHYKGRYLVDIRDFTHEDNMGYYVIEKMVLKNAAFRTISAPGFKKFLPELDYCVCHNVSSAYISGSKKFVHNQGDRIIIGYVGSASYAEQCKKLIDLVKNDERFCFYVYGNENGEKSVTSYINNCNCDRIRYFGEYEPSQKNGILESVDILFNVYGNSKPLVKYALSNKLYDSMYFKKPLLVSPDTDMERESAEFSYAIDFNTDTTLDKLYAWYNSINRESFEKYADAYLNKVFDNNKKFEAELLNFLTNKLQER